LVVEIIGLFETGAMAHWLPKLRNSFQRELYVRLLLEKGIYISPGLESRLLRSRCATNSDILPADCDRPKRRVFMKAWLRRVLAGAAALALLLWGAVLVRADIVIEDFEDGSLSDYTAHAAFGGGDIFAGVVAAAAHDGNFGLRLDGDNWWVSNDPMGMHVAQGDKFFVWEKMALVANGREYFAFGASATNPGYSVVLAPNTGQFMIQKNQPGFVDFNEIAAGPQSYLADHFYRVEVDWGVGGVITALLFDSDGTTLLNTVTATDNAITEGTIAFRGITGPMGGKDFDDVTVLGPTVPEPSTLVLLSLGSFGLLGYGWQSRRRSTKRVVQSWR
jgi:hypothetical protein